jgi:hypothetical protein
MDFWGALKSAARFFDDAALLRLLEQMQSLHSAEICSTEQAQLSGIDAAYQLALPQTLSKITDYIKAHPESFEIPDQYKQNQPSETL